MTFERFALANPLHADLFPCTRKMDAEVRSRQGVRGGSRGRERASG